MPTMWLSDSQSEYRQQFQEPLPSHIDPELCTVSADVSVRTQKSESPSVQVVGRVIEVASVWRNWPDNDA